MVVAVVVVVVGVLLLSLVLQFSTQRTQLSECKMRAVVMLVSVHLTMAW